MSVSNLPYDFFSGKKAKDQKIIFYKYLPDAPAIKSRSVLHKNLISLLIEGEKTIHYANDVITIDEDKFLMLSCGNFIGTEKLSRQRKFTSILVFFDNDILNAFKIKYAKTINGIKASKKSAKKTFLILHKDAFIKNYISSLLFMVDTNVLLSDDMRQLKLEELLLYLLHTNTEAFLSFESLSENEMTDLEIRKNSESHVTSNISVEELAFICNMSLSTFKRKFTQLYHTSPNKWMLERRIDIAKDLLKQAGQKPSDIYHRVGYENHSSFTETFKQLVGVTPKEYQFQNMDV